MVEVPRERIKDGSTVLWNFTGNGGGVNRKSEAKVVAQSGGASSG